MVRIVVTDDLLRLGFKAHNGTIEFPDAKTITDVEAIVKGRSGREIEVQTKAAPVSKEIADTLATRHPEIDFTLGEVFKAVIANSRTDRDNERFTPALLQHFAKRLNDQGGVSICWQHNRDMHGYGSCFEATVDGDELAAYIFVQDDVKTPAGGSLIKAIKGGTEKRLSIGFRAAGSEERLPDGSYMWVYDIQPDRPYTLNAEITEVSFVHLNSQYGAGIKSPSVAAIATQIKIEEVKTVSYMEHQFKIGAKSFTLKVNGDKLEGIEDAQKAFTDGLAALEASKAAQAADLEALRAPLEADVVNSKTPGLTAEVVKAMNVATLIDTANAVREATKSPEQETQKPSTEPRGFFTA